jgi:hypothetical protein
MSDGMIELSTLETGILLFCFICLHWNGGKLRPFRQCFLLASSLLIIEITRRLTLHRENLYTTDMTPCWVREYIREMVTQLQIDLYLC